jgi:hypothetical protein
VIFVSPLPHQSTTDQGRPISLLKSNDFLVGSSSCFFTRVQVGLQSWGKQRKLYFGPTSTFLARKSQRRVKHFPILFEELVEFSARSFALAACLGTLVTCCHAGAGPRCHVLDFLLGHRLDLLISENYCYIFYHSSIIRRDLTSLLVNSGAFLVAQMPSPKLQHTSHNKSKGAGSPPARAVPLGKVAPKAAKELAQAHASLSLTGRSRGGLSSCAPSRVKQ